MRSPWRPARVISLACAAILATLVPAAAVAPPSTDTVYMGHGISVQAPPPGYAVAASALLVDGGHLDLTLETDAHGVTRQIVEPLDAREASSPRITGGPSACSDTKYNLLPFKWHTTWKWRFNAASTPGGISKNKAEAQLRSAVRSITGSRNDCGMTDQVNATASYQGRTSTSPNIDGNYPDMCRARDRVSVVGWGNLPQEVLGLTCTTYQIIPGVDRAIESDVLFNKDDGWAASVSGCVNQAIVRSVATHEFAHVFGLDHVKERYHGQLTMSTSIGACDDSAFTLGRGDVLGLRKRY